MPFTGPQAFDDLLARLAGDATDDVAVVSLAAHRATPAGGWSLVYGSVLLGPPGMASSWLDWRVAAGEQLAATIIGLLGQRKVTASVFAEFAEVSGNWLIARYPLSGNSSAIDLVRDWVQALAGDGVRVQPSSTSPDLVTADLEPADAMVMSSPWWSASLQPLVAAACRPVIGCRFPVARPVGAAPTAPESWPVGGAPFLQPMFSLLGLNPVGRTGPTPPALAIGRLRRTAWFSSLRLPQNLEVDITFDPSRVSARDLEVDLEEYADDGLIQARRLRLADLVLPLGLDRSARVVLPTLGPALRRQLRLYDRAGRLLDNADVSAFVSQINLDITTRIGAESDTRRISVGTAPPTPTPVTRLAALDAAEREYTRMLTEGLDRRILDDPATALAALQEELRGARGELLILDPYFGRKPADWAVLANVRVPVRVLTMDMVPATPTTAKKSARPAALIPLPPQSDVQHLSQLRVKSWPEMAPWHDRVYLWADGGLTVGGSPNGLGKRLMRLDGISPAESGGWRAKFEAWWASPKAVTVL